MHRLLAICVLLATAAGYEYYTATGSAYKHHKSGVSWYVANATCAGEGSHLVVLNDEVEVDIVARIVNYAGGYYATWTGLYDNRPGGVMEWRTVLGEPLSDVFHEWFAGHPQDDARYTCVNFYEIDKLLFNDWACDRPLYFICERAL